MSGFFVSFFAVLVYSIFALVSATPISEEHLQARSKSGQATWFDVGLGNCGQTNVNSDFIVALATSTYAGGAHCGQNVVITDSKTGKTSTAMVRDSCPSCAAGDLDMSPSLFQSFESLDVGVFPITWDFE